MKKQWLSIVLVLCMVLCMAPATALAAEGETGTLKITVDLSGLYDGVDAGGKTFSFEILRKYANYGHYKDVDITIKQGETEGTMDVPVEAGKYIVKQTSHATIDGYDWKNASHQPGNNIESNEQEVFADKTKSVTIHNFYELAVTKEITELPIKINGYALNAKAGDIEASTDQMRVDIHKVTIKQRNASGGWDDLASDATIQANTQYAVEIFVNAKPEYTYTELTKDKVTVNGETASEFEKNPSTQPGVDMRVFHELEVLQVVKTVKSIEITTPPTKTEYMAGDKFDPKGMVVTAHYTDGTTADLTENDYTIFHGDRKGNLKVAYSLRSLISCSEDLILKAADHAKERGALLQAHMNEYPNEINFFLQRQQMRPIVYLAKLGVLDEHFLAAHCILLSENEKDLLKEYDVKTCHCPFSNCGKGVPDTPALLQRGITVGLGTDGAAHGGLSLWNEMKIFRSVMNVGCGVSISEAAVMPAAKIIRMATQGGYDYLQENGGSIAVGKKADFITISLRQPHLYPTGNLVNTLLECVTASDVCDNVVCGKVLMKDRVVQTLDEAQIMEKAEQYFASETAFV